jgi:putative ABC transport system substrate-binding protein
VAVIFAGGGTAAAAKVATSTIPIVFSANTDPVQSGLVTSFNRKSRASAGVSGFWGATAAPAAKWRG